MKRFTILLMSCFLLFGCGLSPSGNLDSTTSYTPTILSSDQYSFFEHKEFRIQYPVSFETLKQNQLENKFSNKALVAFLSNQKSEFFTSNIIIEEVSLGTTVSSELFAESIIENNKKQLNTYQELDRKITSSLVAGSPTTTIMIRFNGRLDLSSDLVEYVQVYLTKENKGYIATSAYDPQDPFLEADKLIDSLKTFQLN